MSNDVKAAMERMWRFRASGAKEIRGSTYEGGVGQHDSDLEEIVAAYLAEHPADEELEIDAEWLRSIQPDRPYLDTILNFAEFPIQCSARHSGLLEFRRSGEVHLCGCVLANPPKTRGCLRRLLVALGVNLKGA